MFKHRLLWAAALLFQAHSFFAQDCSTPFVPSNFKARLAWMSAQNGPSSLAIPVVANMNPQQDSMPEIVVAEGAALGGANNKIQFYRGDGSNAGSPMVLTVPGNFDTYPVPGPTLGDVDKDGKPELIMSCYDGRIRVFRDYTENPTTPMTLWVTSNGTLDFVDQKPFLTDFDADGIPEIYAGSDIFQFNFSVPAAPTLTRVINGPVNKGRSYYSNYNEGSCNPTAADLLSVADCNGDPDCAGLELAAGPVIYSIDLDPTDGDGYEMKVQRNLNNMLPAGSNYGDGYTAVADADLDGVLDVVVTGKRFTNQAGLYVWNKNGLLRFFPYPASAVAENNGSLACIANVYSDAKAGFAKDLPEIMVCNSRNFTCFNLNAAVATPAAPYWWNLPTTDVSGWTGATVYDFNGDDISEIVYRDEQNLRILYGGPAPFPPGVDAQRNWFTAPCFSQTSDEYPVVADVDNDGETEIAVTGATTGTFNSRGRLRVYESASGPWVPSRNLWNQYNYFIVNVNDDLSIPAPQMPSHHLELPAPGSGKRPLNRYLSQRPMFNANYEVLIPLPDAAAQVTQLNCNGDSLTVWLSLCNSGDKTLSAGIPVTFYSSDPTLTPAAQLGSTQLTPVLVKKDSCATFTFTVPKMLGALFGVVNDDGSKPRPFQLETDFPVTNELECHWLNNLFQFNFQIALPPLDLGPDISTCRDTLVSLTAPAGYHSYRWQDGSASPSLQAQTPGLYWVETTDFCLQKHRDSLQIEVFGYPSLQLDTLNGDCFGKPASVAATAAGAHPPLSYLWSSGDTTAALSGIPDGLYAITVTNAKGCSTTQSTWVEAGGNLQVSTTATAIPCFGQTSTVSLHFAAGRPPYTYLWSDGSTAAELSTAAAGPHSVTVTDADGCAQILHLTLPQPEALVSAGILTQAACPGEANGGATFLGAAQGTPPYALRWSGGQTDPKLTGLPVGIYTLSITDANGCELLETVQVPEFSAPAVQTAVSDLSCFGKNDGSAAVALTGGSPGFGYAWSNGSAAPKIEGLAPGTYTLTLTYADARCAQIFDFQIKEPLPILLSATAGAVACHGGSEGSIDLTVQNGIAPHTFFWSNSSTVEDPTGLTAGIYTVTVTDATGCSKTAETSLTEPSALSSAGISSQPACPGEANGQAAFLGASQGTPPYSLLWSDGQTTPSLTGLAAGTYTLSITDAQGCELVETVQVPAFLPPTVQAVVSDVSCFGKNDGSMAVALTGGSPGFGYAWSGGSAAPKIESLAPGTYTLTLTYADAKCSQTFDFQVKEPLPILLAATPKPAACHGGSEGSVDLTVQNGIAPHTFFWSNSATSEDLAQLGAGGYQVTVTDATGCTQMLATTVTEPTALASAGITAQAACPDEANGEVSFLGAAQGTPPYALLWSNSQTAPNLTGLAAGTYTLSITDVQGCSLVETVQVPAFLPPTVQAVVSDVSCFGKNDGSAEVTLTGGSPGFGYAWSSGSAAPKIESLTPGTYTLTLTYADAKCAQTFDFQIKQPDVLAFLDTAKTAVRCFGEANGAVNLTAAGGTPPYQFSWSNGQKTEDLAQVTAGTYTLTLTDAKGCTHTAQFAVPQPDLLTLSATVGADTCESSSGTVLSAAAGGSQPYQFFWSNAATASSLTGLAAGAYALTLTDANGCTRTLSVQVPAFGKIPHLTPFAEAITCAHPAAAVGVLADQSGLHYAWSAPSGPLPDEAAHTVLSGGLYRVTATNSFGCQADAQVLVPEDKAKPAAEAGPPTLQVPCSQTKVVLSAAGSSQGAGFVNRWLGLPIGLDTLAVTVPIFEPGLYVHTVLNTANGCTEQDSIWVHWPEPIRAEVAVEAIRCFGDNDGVIRIQNVSGGTPPLRYSIDNLNFKQQSEFEGLLPGQYPVRVEDGSGCWWATSVTLTEPPQISVRLTASDTSIELGHYVQLVAQLFPKGAALSNMVWEPLGVTFTPKSLTQRVKPEQHTEFVVRVFDQNGCPAEDRVLVKVHNYGIYVPNIISPSSTDNGRFTIFAGEGVLQIRLLRVYSRWGELVFERQGFAPNDVAAGWDGAFRGQPLSPGVFGWYAEVLLQDGQTLLLKGDVTVLR